MRLHPQQLIVHAKHRRVTKAEVERRVDAVNSTLRQALANALRREGLSNGLRVSLQGWVDRIARPPLDDIPDELWTSAMEASDPCIALHPYPSHAVPVSTPPLPPLPKPPPTGAVPRWARDWHHALRPQAFFFLLDLMKRSRSYAREHATLGERATARKPPTVALGPEAFRPWAKKLIERGEVLVRDAHGLRVLDRSKAPPSHFGKPYIAEKVLNASSDFALRDGILTHGIMFTLGAPLPPYLLIQQNMNSIADGLETVHSELEKMETRGWYTREVDALDAGVLPFDCMPVWFNPNGAVPRKLSSLVPHLPGVRAVCRRLP